MGVLRFESVISINYPSPSDADCIFDEYGRFAKDLGLPQLCNDELENWGVTELFAFIKSHYKDGLIARACIPKIYKSKEDNRAVFSWTNYSQKWVHGATIEELEKVGLDFFESAMAEAGFIFVH